MSGTTKIILSFLIAAVVAGGGAFTGVATDLGPNQDIGDIRIVTWVVIAITALVAGATDLKTYLAAPPNSGSD